MRKNILPFEKGDGAKPTIYQGSIAIQIIYGQLFP